MVDSPTASIIISAYNRPKVIAYAIKSVLRSDFDDFELIVVGDGCNTETENAVRQFSDPRIRFENLPENTGHQSAPHNRGVELARGEFILFLNQDDMYFPDHVSKRIDFMRATGAEISWCPVLLLQHSGVDRGPIDVAKDRVTLDGAVAGNRYSPHSFIISSSWAFKRDVCAVVGPWLTPQETRLSPSQEWLFRAYRMGRHMAYHPHPSVLCIHSGVRRYSYIKAESPEHERAWSWIAAGETERMNLMTCASVRLAADLAEARRKNRRALTRLQRLVSALGVHPDSFNRLISGLKRGEWVNSHRRFTSKPPELRFDRSIPFGAVAADDFAGSGWHLCEPHGRWTAGRVADLFFTVPISDRGSRSLVLELSGHPLRLGDDVEFRLNTGASITKKILSLNEVTRVPLPGPGSFHLTISVENPTSPKKTGAGSDERILGYCLNSLRLTAAPASAENIKVN
jgi:glycosyltransferase involved in cell wall biosynthesis